MCVGHKKLKCVLEMSGSRDAVCITHIYRIVTKETRRMKCSVTITCQVKVSAGHDTLLVPAKRTNCERAHTNTHTHIYI
jgi:hypothetical protein